MNKFFSVGLMTLLILMISQNAWSQHGPAKPNIIFILADDLGIGDLSCFNPNGKINTPHIDEIANNGVQFTDAHSSSAVCTPTRYGILTGRYNWRSSIKQGVLVPFSAPLIPASRTNMASMLKKKGYQTACIGKWHLGWNWPTTDNKMPVDNKHNFNLDYTQTITGGPVDIGFDYFFGMDAPNYPPYTFIENRNTVGLPNVFYPTQPYADCRPGRGVDGWKLENIFPALQQKTVDYIRASAKKEAPFFLYLPLTAPHTPIAPDQSFKDQSGLNAYADFVLQIDHLVGVIQQTLQENRLNQNTILIFTSDNGCSPHANFPFLQSRGHQPSQQYRGQKSDLFEGGHRIPCLVQWPAAIKKPHTVTQTVSLNDFMATFAAITDYSLADNEAEDSYNLMPVLLKKKAPTLREATVNHSIDGSFAIRKGEWKLLLAAGSGGWSFPQPGKEEEGLPTVQLYNLDKDPGEKNNLELQYPELVKSLTALLKKYIQDGRSTPGKPQKNDGIYPWPQISRLGL